MKGLSIKRIAAIGLGAALVGSALAPGVMAANFSNLDTLQKSNVIDATGSPVVDIVVGTIGMPEDVVWAGNIAAKVAQMAVVPAGGSTTVGEKTVDLTVGGAVVTSGSGYTDKADLNNFAGTPDDRKLATTVTDMPSLINNTSWAYKDLAQGSTSTYVSEQLDANVKVIYQDDQGSNRFAPGELLASVDATNKVSYQVNISPGYPILAATMTDLDANVNVDYTVPIFGKTYVIDRIESSGAKLVMYDKTTPTQLDKGQSVTVTSATDANKTYTLEVVDVTKTADNVTYTASFVLKDGSTVVDSKDNISNNTDLKSAFGDKFADTVYVTYVGISATTAGKAYVSLRTGNTRLEIRDNEAFPYSTNSSENNKAAWKADIDYGTAGNYKLNSIKIYNNWRYDQTSGSTSDLVKAPLKVGESINIGTNFAKLSFVGLEDKPTTTHTLGGGKLAYKDYKGSTIELPFYVENQLTEDAYSKVTINGRTYTFHFFDKADVNTDSVLQYALGSFDNNSSGDWSNTVTWTSKLVTGTPVLAPTFPTVSLDLGAYGNGIVDKTDYVFRYPTTVSVGNLMKDNYLALAGDQTFDLYSKTALNYTTELTFLGTAVPSGETETGDINRSWYEPHSSTLGYTNDKSFNVAVFKFNEGVTGSLATKDVNMYINTATGNVLDVEANSTNLSAPTKDAASSQWNDSIRGGSDYLESGMTQYGTSISSDGSVFTVVLPEERRQAQVYLGGADLVSTPGAGTDYTGVKAGDLVTNGGVTVKVNSISGTAGTASGVTVTPVANLVKSDKTSSYGKSILVGGWMANTKVSKSMMVGGETLESRLTAGGDYVSAVLEDGSIVVAGWTADDTATAAQALIAALDTLQ